MEQAKQSEQNFNTGNNRIKSIVMVSIALAIIFLPMVLLFTVGEAAHDLDGESDYERPSFSIGSFFDGDFQSAFENWFSTKYPLRPEIVELYGRFDASKDSVNINFLRTNPSKSNTVNTAVPETTTASEEEIVPETEEVVENDVITPKFPEYNLIEYNLRDPEGYRGTDHVVIGKNGCLYENGYINELFGFSKKYIQVTDDDLWNRVDILKYIQDELEAKGIAFCVVITPSKASAMPDYVPDWYFDMFPPVDPEYVRPYTRFVDFLEKTGVYFVDSASLYRSLGLTNTFPKTGIHWNKFASFETSVAMIAEYERQTGTEVKHLAADEIRYSKNPPGFGNPEMDIFGIVYSGKRNERENAIVDERYYWHEAYTGNMDKPSIPHMFIQGGSFTGDFHHYFSYYNIAANMSGFYYNNGGNMKINWEKEINRASYVVLEVNEQFVYNMGGNAPSWGQNDIAVLPFGNNIIDSLYDYLVANP